MDKRYRSILFLVINEFNGSQAAFFHFCIFANSRQCTRTGTSGGAASSGQTRPAIVGGWKLLNGPRKEKSGERHERCTWHLGYRPVAGRGEGFGSGLGETA